MTKLISQFLLLTLTAIMLGLFIITQGTGHQETAMSGAAITIILLSLAIERMVPFRGNWNESDGDAVGDITLFVVIFGGLDSALKWLTPFLLLYLIGDWSTGLITLPLWAQAILAGLMIELGAYASHYLHHTNKFLWPLHAMHHSPERLYTLNNFRFHPLNHILNHLIMILPPLLVGFSGEAILLYTAVSMPILLLQHANVDFKFGIFNTILNTNEMHRWHHSTAPNEGNSNFGRATLIWDRVFGTYYFAPDRNTPDQLGLFSSGKSYPPARKLLAQILYPFSSACCSRS